MYTSKFLMLTLCAGLAALSGCQTISLVPSFRNVAIDPAQLRPGDLAVISVEVQDKNDIVSRVQGVLKEVPEVTFALRDDGVDPDARANDGIWSMRVNVPFDAPPGQFTLEFTAYRSDGQVVTVRNESGNVVPLSATYPFTVQYAQSVPQP